MEKRVMRNSKSSKITNSKKLGRSRTPITLAGLDRRLRRLEKANRDCKEAVRYGINLFSQQHQTTSQPT